MRKTWILIVITVLGAFLAVGCGNTLRDNLAPDFKLKNLDGQTVSLSALRGRPVLLNFWASWCGPCRSEMPFLQEIHLDHAWKAQNLVVLGVNLDESEAVVRKFMTDNGLSFTVLLDAGGNAARLYNVSSIPATFIIGKDGIIKNGRVGAFTSKKQIDQMLQISLAE